MESGIKGTNPQSRSKFGIITSFCKEEWLLWIFDEFPEWRFHDNFSEFGSWSHTRPKAERKVTEERSSKSTRNRCPLEYYQEFRSERSSSLVALTSSWSAHISWIVKLNIMVSENKRIQPCLLVIKRWRDSYGRRNIHNVNNNLGQIL